MSLRENGTSRQLWFSASTRIKLTRTNDRACRLGARERCVGFLRYLEK